MDSSVASNKLIFLSLAIVLGIPEFRGIGTERGGGTIMEFRFVIDGSRGGAADFGAAGAPYFVSYGATKISAGTGGGTGTPLGTGGIFDLYRFLMPAKRISFSWGMPGGGGTMIEFLLITDRSMGGGCTTFTGAGGASTVVKATIAGSSGIGGRAVSIFGGFGIFFMYRFLMASPRICLI